MPGQTTLTLAVPILNDALDEVDETFFVNLSNPRNAEISDAQGMGTIGDDDPTPALAINDVTVSEAESGVAIASFDHALGPQQPAGDGSCQLG